MTGKVKNPDSLESSLKVMTERVAHLRTCISEKTSEKTNLQRELESIYEAPLRDEQVIEFMTELIDYRAGFYEAEVRSVGMLEALKFPKVRSIVQPGISPAHLVLGDVEKLLGNERLDEKKDSNPIDQFAIEIFRDYGVFKWWPYFFFGEVMKEKFSAIMRSEAVGHGSSEVHETLEVLRERATSLHKKILTVSEEIDGLNDELAELVQPLKATMKMISVGE